MATETVGMERALGAIGSTFRMTRLYPPLHPALVEAYLDGSLGQGLNGHGATASAWAVSALRREEAALLLWLKKRNRKTTP